MKDYMATGRGGSAVQTKLGFLIFGEQGAWKSSLSLEFMKFIREDGKPFRVLFIDPEQGSVDSYLEKYELEGYDLRNIFIIYTQSISEVKEFIRKAKDNEDFYEFDENGDETDTVYLDADGLPFRPDAIVVDGITLLYVAKQQSMLEFSKKRATVRAKKNELIGMEKEVAIEGSGIEIKDYQTLKFEGQDLILDLLASGKHFATTCREEDEKEPYKDKNGEIKSMATGRKIPSGFKDIRYNVKTVLHTFKDTDGVMKAIVENKDRTLVHKQDEILIEPTLLDWQIVIDKNKGKKDFVIANNLNKAVEAERKAIEKDNAKFDDEFESSNNTATTAELKTAEDYHKAIGEAITKLSATDKSKKQKEVADANLPKAYQKLSDISQLKTYLSIINK
jgi:hypothetical protein